jgi:thiol-disulfide isomerase/thioredoxin
MLPALLLSVVLLVQPATRPGDVEALRAAVVEAHAALPASSMSGVVSMDLRYGGMSFQERRRFTASFAEGLYRHESENGKTVVAEADGTVTVYDAASNTYLTSDPASATEGETPPSFATLRRENPLLLLAVTDGDLNSLLEGAGEVAAETVDGRDVLRFARGNVDVALFFDANSRQLVRREVDVQRQLETEGLTDVEAGLLVVEYDAVEPLAEVSEELFTFRAPAGAMDGAPPEMMAGGGAAAALEGQAAPDFTLPRLGEGEMTLSELQGEVVVLDFWASWCGPCVEGLPHLQRVAQRENGPIVLAINVQETPDVIGQFLQRNDLQLTTLLDADGAVSELYGVTGIPQTVVIRPDGTVQKVLVGFGPNTPGELDAAIAAASIEAAE